MSCGIERVTENCQGWRSKSTKMSNSKYQSRAKGQIHLIGYNLASNCHRDFKHGSYFSLWKVAPNMTLTLKSLPKVKIFETSIKENCQRGRWKSTKRSNSLKLTLTLKILSEIKSCGIGDYCWLRFALYESGASSYYCYCYYHHHHYCHWQQQQQKQYGHILCMETIPVNYRKLRLISLLQFSE